MNRVWVTYDVCTCVIENVTGADSHTSFMVKSLFTILRVFNDIILKLFNSIVCTDKLSASSIILGITYTYSIIIITCITSCNFLLEERVFISDNFDSFF